jgi:Protein of unknown function (DUF3034)
MLCARTHYVDWGALILLYGFGARRCKLSRNLSSKQKKAAFPAVLQRALSTISIAVGLFSNAVAGDRLAWTGAVSEVEGSAGGGLVPWALLGGLGTADQVGAAGFFTHVKTGDFSLRSGGFAVGIRDRIEISFARQRFDAGAVIPGLTLGQDITGVKVRLAGDAVFAPDQWMPQIAIGAQYKKTLDFDLIPRAVGARRGDDVDLYVAATKLYFAAAAGRNVLLNATLRRTRADQFGLLGFGGDRGAGFSYLPEFSAAVWVSDNWLTGAEYRFKPNDLSAFREDHAQDVFIAWNPVKVLTLTLAYLELGHVAGKGVQQGLYASLWVGF